MKKIIILFYILSLSACSYIPVTYNKAKTLFPRFYKQEYVTGTEDLPLYSGFKEVNNSNISYDSIDGRIVDATFYSNNADTNNVREFYEKTLPQLGWIKREYQIYDRDGETLKMSILQEGKKTKLQFIIRPM